jgi:hypothetical protein
MIACFAIRTEENHIVLSEVNDLKTRLFSYRGLPGKAAARGT